MTDRPLSSPTNGKPPPHLWLVQLVGRVSQGAPDGGRVSITMRTIAASIVLHGAAVSALWISQTVAPPAQEPVTAQVTLIDARPTPVPTPPPAPVATPEPVATPRSTPVPKKEPPKEKVEKTRQARAREDERVKPAEQPEEPVEIRGGLSDSTALDPALSTGAPAVALGNSAEVAVDPSKGDLPPPAPVAPGTNSDDVDYSARAVEEAFADTEADCSGSLPELELTEDAVNAGVSSGKLLIEVIIDEKGTVRNVKLVKGTGYEIDRIAVEAIRSIKCVAATSNGEPTIVRKELFYEIVN
jgi:TonB family protein